MAATILLVDADLSNSSDWQEVLEDHGYRVFAAGNGRAALEECPQLQPDLVLLQSSLPDMQGLEVCRRLKNDSRNHLTPIIVMAPGAMECDALRAREAGADDFWGNPSSRWEALSRVQSILHLKSYIDEQAESVVMALARSIEARDPLSAGHCQRVSEYATLLGKRLGLPQDDVQALGLAGLLHDVGKVAVPDAILFKPAPLSREEFDIMKQHSMAGERICAPIKSLRAVLPVIRHHHERIDGTGYPDGLRGENIPLNARIMHVVDVYDALTTDRPYRKHLSRECATNIMLEEVGKSWLDSSLVDQFISLPLRLHAANTFRH
ncbi:MAG TPA: HD domain-containing phosphohydrolase [Candidatus Acidoferrum sp.]|nr:HD domain-containing phosphohydrolase [Candidatus Acidoferrum sp.]